MKTEYSSIMTQLESMNEYLPLCGYGFKHADSFPFRKIDAQQRSHEKSMAAQQKSHEEAIAVLRNDLEEKVAKLQRSVFVPLFWTRC